MYNVTLYNFLASNYSLVGMLIIGGRTSLITSPPHPCAFCALSVQVFGFFCARTNPHGLRTDCARTAHECARMRTDSARTVHRRHTDGARTLYLRHNDNHLISVDLLLLSARIAHGQHMNAQGQRTDSSLSVRLPCTVRGHLCAVRPALKKPE